MNRLHDPTATSTPCSVDGDGGGPDEAGRRAATTDQELARQLASRAGDVATAERDRAVRAFGDGSDRSADAHRILTTMAVRIAVGLCRTPMAAAADDEARVETMTELFLADE